MNICLAAARHALAALLACLALSLFAPAAWADCPPNALDLGGQCFSCPAPLHPNPTKTVCVPCPTLPGTPYSGGEADGCLLCSEGNIPNSTGTACIPIPAPQCGPFKHVSRTGCPSGQFYCCQGCGTREGWYQQGSTGEGQCFLCVLGQVPNPTQDDFNLDPCIPCGGGTIAAGQTCSACTGNTVANESHSACKACTNGYTTGYVANAAHTQCVCPAGTVAAYENNSQTQSFSCVRCPSNQIPNPAQTACSPCPAGTTAQFGSCVKYQASPSPVLPGPPKKPSPPRPRAGPVTGPGLLESTPGLGTQGPAAVGTPLGGPRGGGR